MFSVFRSPQNPFLSPSKSRAWEAIATFNPSVVAHGGETHVFYRAMAEPDDLRTPGRGFSTIGYTTLAQKDGPTIVGDRTQALTPTEQWEYCGMEDPRATFFEGKWYVFYTALGGYPFGPDNIKVAVAVGDTPTTLTEKHLLTPFNAKAATLFPERINGDVVMIVTAHTDWTEEHQHPTIGIARAKDIEEFWSEAYWREWHNHLDEHAFPDVRRSDTEHMEVGAAPLLTKHGWLLVYSHIQKYYDEPNRIFGIEALLLDRNDPTRVIAKTEFPFLVPEESYEQYGLVSNITFPSGALLEGDTLHVYYGGADTVCAAITLSLSNLLSSMSIHERTTFMTRIGDGPIMSPIPEHEWESAGVANAAAIDLDGSVHLLYRATDHENRSTIGYARLSDGMHIDERLAEPIYAPHLDYPSEQHGTEDPRITQIGDTLYLTYTAFDGSIARGAMATIPVSAFLDGSFTWSEPILLTPEGTNNKDVCIIPELVDDEVVFMHRIDPNICIDRLQQMPPAQTITRSIELMHPRTGMWDGIKVGSAAPPMRVAEGWLYVYHAVGPDYAYRLGAALLNDSLSVVLGRTAAPILEPVMKWEREGTVKDVVFSCGMVLRDDTLFIYYGGADTSLGVATISKTELIKRLLPS